MCVRRSVETSARSFEAWERRRSKVKDQEGKDGASVTGRQQRHRCTLGGAGRRAVQQRTFDLGAAKGSLRHC